MERAYKKVPVAPKKILIFFKIPIDKFPVSCYNESKDDLFFCLNLLSPACRARADGKPTSPSQ